MLGIALNASGRHSSQGGLRTQSCAFMLTLCRTHDFAEYQRQAHVAAAGVARQRRTLDGSDSAFRRRSRASQRSTPIQGRYATPRRPSCCYWIGTSWFSCRPPSDPRHTVGGDKTRRWSISVRFVREFLPPFTAYRSSAATSTATTRTDFSVGTGCAREHPQNIWPMEKCQRGLARPGRRGTG
jgi:hypothetical protein